MMKYVFNPLTCDFDIVASTVAEAPAEAAVTVPFKVMLGKDFGVANDLAVYECGIDNEFALDDINNDTSENYIFIIVPQGDTSRPFAMDYIASNGIVIPTSSNSIVIDNEPFTCYMSNNPITSGKIENITIRLKQIK